MGVPSAVCSKCGSRHHGWALLNPRHQTCPRCGAGLEISVNGQIFEGYSPFKAEKLTIKKPEEIPPVTPPLKEKQP